MAGREQIRRARSAREITGARDLAGRVGAVSAPRAEIHHRSSARGGDHPRGLAREHALQMNLVQHKRLDKLGLDDWRDQLDRGFVRKITVPSGAAQTSPVKRTPASHLRNSSENWPRPRR